MIFPISFGKFSFTVVYSSFIPDHKTSFESSKIAKVSSPISKSITFFPLKSSKLICVGKFAVSKSSTPKIMVKKINNKCN